MLETDRGQVLFKASANNMPADAEELADEIESAIERYKSDCGPDCQPSPQRHKPNIPDLRKNTKQPSGNIPLIAVCAIGGAILLAVLLRR